MREDYIDLTDIPESDSEGYYFKDAVKSFIDRLGDQEFTCHQLFLLMKQDSKHRLKHNLKEDIRRRLYYLKEEGYIEQAVKGVQGDKRRLSKWRRL